MIMRHAVGAADIARFPRLRAIVRMGVGYDKIDRPAAAARNILVCNVPDYGTTEVADHAMALVLALRRGVVLYHERLRANPPAPWGVVKNDLIRRLGVQTFGILGLGRIGTAVALRARAFGFRVVFYDPYLPNGADLALGIGRAATLEDLLRQTDTLSVHAPLTPETRLMLGRDQLSLLRPGAVVVNAARGPIIDLDALLALLRGGHIAAAGLDVLPVEPPVEPFPETPARLPRARAGSRRAPGDHPARRLVHPRIGARHAGQIGRDDARRPADQPAAERDRAGDVLIRLVAPFFSAGDRGGQCPRYCFGADRVTPCRFIRSTTLLAPASPPAASSAVLPAKVCSCRRSLIACSMVGCCARLTSASALPSWIA